MLKWAYETRTTIIEYRNDITEMKAETVRSLILILPLYWEITVVHGAMGLAE